MQKQSSEGAILCKENIREQLGTGFAYMGREVRIEVGETEKFIDMLFYNTKRHCYVVLEVKTGKYANY
ncbi:PDDEXK nuclease domain-containing protein [Pseudobutyrivibrio xylanivorans]|uniref:PDDEXK nuclease domain-containing protein n=1 Tax=Pseudobutyrivibrio xylanivorans TaxID=185007 RepID=UPI000AD69210|nr:PDDEXK nuclease domain-containing protein [Pseudobutyrivibrio xylanivorans]